MSMNLYFETVVDQRHIHEDFPFQTPTELTYRVMKLGTKEEQIKEIRSYIEEKYEWDKEDVERVMSEIEYALSTPTTKLEMM